MGHIKKTPPPPPPDKGSFTARVSWVYTQPHRPIRRSKLCDLFMQQRFNRCPYVTGAYTSNLTTVHVVPGQCLRYIYHYISVVTLIHANRRERTTAQQTVTEFRTELILDITLSDFAKNLTVHVSTLKQRFFRLVTYLEQLRMSKVRPAPGALLLFPQ